MQLTQVRPTEEQMAKIKTYPKDTPLVMINIIKFKDRTENGNETGKEAYARYFRNAKPFIARSNAKLIWKGVVATTVIGDPENEPDIIIDYLIHNEVDVKREDALLVIEKIKELAGL